MRRLDTIVPATVLGGDEELEVEFNWHPGSPPSGLTGPPEHYDPGEGPDVELLKTTRGGTEIALDDEEREAVELWLAENYVDDADYDGGIFDDHDYDD